MKRRKKIPGCHPLNELVLVHRAASVHQNKLQESWMQRSLICRRMYIVGECAGARDGCHISEVHYGLSPRSGTEPCWVLFAPAHSNASRDWVIITCARARWACTLTELSLPYDQEICSLYSLCVCLCVCALVYRLSKNTMYYFFYFSFR